MTCCDCGKKIKEHEPIIAAFTRHNGGWRFTGECWHRGAQSQRGEVMWLRYGRREP